MTSAERLLRTRGTVYVPDSGVRTGYSPAIISNKVHIIKNSRVLHRPILPKIGNACGNVDLYRHRRIPTIIVSTSYKRRVVYYDFLTISTRYQIMRAVETLDRIIPKYRIAGCKKVVPTRTESGSVSPRRRRSNCSTPRSLAQARCPARRGAIGRSRALHARGNVAQARSTALRASGGGCRGCRATTENGGPRRRLGRVPHAVRGEPAPRGRHGAPGAGKRPRMIPGKADVDEIAPRMTGWRRRAAVDNVGKDIHEESSMRADAWSRK